MEIRNDGDGRFQALADPTRRDILRRLRGGSRTAGELADAFELSKPTMSHHFSVLEKSGLIRSERRGNFIVYALQTSVVEEVAAALMDLAASARRPTKKEKVTI
jgi:ArsR family transcriptional regulator, arsenate/arsenite/antimonite-responsive transcriptional repressor